MVQKLRKLSLYRLCNYLFRKLPPAWVAVPSASLVLTAGARALPAWAHPQLIGPATRVIDTHSFDYEAFLKAGPAGPGKGAVFLDEYYPFHWEWAARGLSAPPDPRGYYDQLCRVFRQLESSGVPVTIAAHPSADYSRHPDFFEGRRVVYGATAELIRDCELVLAHASTALSYAVLYRRPIVLLTSSQLQGSITGAAVRALAEELNLRPVWTDEAPPLLELKPEVEERTWSAYQNAYIKRDGSPAVPTWKLLAQSVRSLA